MALTQVSTDGIKNGTITGSDLATNVDLVDDQKLRLGNSQNLQIYHEADGSSYITNSTSGHLIIKTINGGSDINLECNDDFFVRTASGTQNSIIARDYGQVELYYSGNKKFETSSSGAIISGILQVSNGSAAAPAIHFGDSDSGVYGDSSNGVRLTAGGSDTIVATTNGVTFPSSVAALTSLTLGSQSALSKPLYFADSASVQSASILLDNSSQELRIKNGRFAGKISFTTYNVERANIDNSGNFNIANDLGKIQLGASQDLQIYHDGSNSYIKNATNSLYINSAAHIYLANADNSEFKAKFHNNSSVQLFHAGSKKFETASYGAVVTGTFQATGNIEVFDNGKLNVGTGADLQIFHSSNENIIGVNTVGQDIFFKSSSSSALDTTSFVVRTDGSVTHPDNIKMKFGTSDDLQLYHTGSHSYIKDAGTGNLIVSTSQMQIINAAEDKMMARFDQDGAVELYHNNVKMLDTSSQGVNFRGEIRSASTSSSLSNCTLKNESTGADGTDYFQCRTDNNTLRLVIEPDGDVKNQNNSYGQSSDLKLKENIVDANSQWNDIKAIKVRNFNFKESTGFSTHTQIGVVAQELEIISPHLVYESTDRDPNTNVDLGTKTKNVRYSVMYMKAIKCLQEAMAKIEVLETEVAALKAA